MKMYMPLVAAEDGIVQFVKQLGVSLEPGDILGILTLDDPARVKHAKPFEGLLPAVGVPSVVGNKPNQRFQSLLGILNDILDGFDNQAIMLSTLKDFIETLHNHDLPYSEMTSVLSSLSGRMSSKLEDSIRATIETAKSKGEHTEFPAVRLKKLLEHHVQETVRPADQGTLRTQLSPLFSIVERYLHGLKEHEVTVIGDLLSRYEQTEILFNGSIEARILLLREQNKDDLDKVVSLVLSHAKAQSKGKLVMALLEHVKSSGLILPESRMYQVLQGLAALEARYVYLLL
jgi:acetyl-CoA carboxylase / biotin carboxylase 1